MGLSRIMAVSESSSLAISGMRACGVVPVPFENRVVARAGKRELAVANTSSGRASSAIAVGVGFRAGTRRYLFLSTNTAWLLCLITAIAIARLVFPGSSSNRFCRCGRCTWHIVVGLETFDLGALDSIADQSFDIA